MGIQMNLHVIHQQNALIRMGITFVNAHVDKKLILATNARVSFIRSSMLCLIINDNATNFALILLPVIFYYDHVINSYDIQRLNVH